MTLKRSLKVIQTGTIRKLGCGFLFDYHSNHGKGGATVLKVGGGQFCERSEPKKIFDPPTFGPVGGTKYC